MQELENGVLLNQIETLLEQARYKVSTTVNNTLLITYMEIGKLIVEDINNHSSISAYEAKSLRKLSKDLTQKFIKRIFSVKHQQYDKLLQSLQRCPDTVWTLRMVSLL